MTRGEVDGEWSRVGTFHYVSFVKPVSLAAGIISGSLPFFLWTSAALFLAPFLFSGRAEKMVWAVLLCSEATQCCL